MIIFFSSFRFVSIITVSFSRFNDFDMIFVYFCVFLYLLLFCILYFRFFCIFYLSLFCIFYFIIILYYCLLICIFSFIIILYFVFYHYFVFILFVYFVFSTIEKKLEKAKDISFWIPWRLYIFANTNLIEFIIFTSYKCNITWIYHIHTVYFPIGYQVFFPENRRGWGERHWLHFYTITVK